ncbi:MULTISPECIES: TNT domain-containing protein [Streptomyces]|uniref:TNT domain-containing protein n=1 Tax=Streptomyces TaxID=1883 RepID=UPI0029A86FC8|nr:TNT domain-containing protein [Streptomyces sp. WI03-4A]MDX2598017.1 TNT domain-containing protein [Streptomyces sp. WI03-4A]
MRVLRALVGSVLASLLLMAGIAPATAQADRHPAVRGAHCPTADRGRGTNSPPSTALQPYFLDDWRLGPRQLPRTGALGKMLRGYHRTDSVSPYWFLGCYWQTDPRTGKSGWWYPDHDGFVLRDGKPLERTVTLRKGQLVDLFGSGFGNFLAPAGTPYAQRAIPPSNLDSYVEQYPFSYHLYRVREPFSVRAGPIRPWFGQPGLGLQYVTTPSVADLVASHHLDAVPVA